MRPSAADVQAWLDDRADEMATLLETLVRLPTENPPGRELGRCAGLLRDALDRLGFAPELIELPSTGDSKRRRSYAGRSGMGRGSSTSTGTSTSSRRSTPPV